MQRIQAGRERKAGDPFNKGQPRANRAAGLILVGLRVAEIGKHPIAHVLREEAIEPGDGTGAGLLEGSENASILFRIEADEIARLTRPRSQNRMVSWRRSASGC